MARKGRQRLCRLVELVAQAHPQLEDPAQQIHARRVSVDGRIVDNPASLVRQGAAIAIVRDKPLRGEAKLDAALQRFGVSVGGRVALDLGAAAGGFTRVLLRAGAAKVYAVDAGFGQLVGSLRQDARVVNVERTNVAALNLGLIRDAIDVVTADLSYLALADAVAQVTERLEIAQGADLLGLIKPQFELGRSRPPTDPGELAAAIDAAVTGVAAAGWRVEGTIESPVRGSREAVEMLLHAVWRPR